MQEYTWYCSELVWAGYMKAGINLITQTPEVLIGVTPRDITLNSSKVTLIPIK